MERYKADKGILLYVGLLSAEHFKFFASIYPQACFATVIQSEILKIKMILQSIDSITEYVEPCKCDIGNY